MINQHSPPLVSVVIPCLNRAHFLVPTIESILQQDYGHVECIVVDGGSTDGTVDIMRSYGNKIRWVSEPDNSHADAVNKGWKMSQGEILAWLNADDMYVLPDAVRKAAEFLQKNPEIDVVYGDCAFIDLNGKTIGYIRTPPEWNLENAVKYCHHIIYQPSSFIRRTILEKVDWLDPEIICFDHDLWYRIGLVAKIKYLHSLLAYARKCPGMSQRPDIAQDKPRITKKFFNIPNLPPPFNSKRFQRRALSNAYLIGSNFAWGGGHLKIFGTSFIKAMAYDPLNLPYILSSTLLLIAASTFAPIMPDGFKKVIRRVLGLSNG